MQDANVGAGRIHIAIQTEDFDLSAEVAALRAADPGVGAVCAFVGTVRDRNDGQPVRAMTLDDAARRSHDTAAAMFTVTA